MKSTIHVAMFPWFAMGHIFPFLHLADELASRGHKISFLLPKGAQSKAQSLSGHPQSITFHPLTVPHVAGLPHGAETATDAPFPAVKHLFVAFDQTQDQVKSILAATAPDFVIFDLAHWVPPLARELGITAVYFHIASAAPIALATIAWRMVVDGESYREYRTPPGFPPSSSLFLRRKDLEATRATSDYFGAVDPPGVRVRRGVAGSEGFAIWSCREIDPHFPQFLETQFEKPLLLTGHLLRLQNRGSSSSSSDDHNWGDWMDKFPPNSIVYCAFGSEFTPGKEQFEELLLGFELCGRPFIVATTKPPRGCSTIEESLPAGFPARVGDRGRVHCGWVPQVRILEHGSVGCFVSHSGSSSMWEALLSECRIVLMPNIPLQTVTAMFLAEELKVAVEVEKGDGGWVRKEELRRAIEVAMDEESEVGGLMKKNHDMYRSLITRKGVQDSYTDDFICKLNGLKKV